MPETKSLRVASRRAKKAIDYHLSLHDIPAVFSKPCYRNKVGGMKLLDHDRLLAEAAMRREFALIGRVTALRSSMERKARAQR